MPPHLPTPASLAVLVVKLITDGLEAEFLKVVIGLFKHLSEMAKKAPNLIEDIRTFLLALQIRFDMKHTPFFSSKRKKKIMNATTIGEFQNLICSYCNFLNISLFEQLVKEFGEGIVENDFDSYLNHLRIFRANTRICVFIEAQALRNVTIELPPDFIKVKVRMGDSWNHRNLNDVKGLHLQLCRKASVTPHVVFFMYGTLGSIVLVWGVARSNFALSSLLWVLDETEMAQLDLETVNCDAAFVATGSLATPEDVEEIEQPSYALAATALRAELEQAGEYCISGSFSGGIRVVVKAECCQIVHIHKGMKPI